MNGKKLHEWKSYEFVMIIFIKLQYLRMRAKMYTISASLSRNLYFSLQKCFNALREASNFVLYFWSMNFLCECTHMVKWQFSSVNSSLLCALN